MGLDIHTIDLKAGSSALSEQDRIKMIILEAVANVIGGGAGQSVVTAVGGFTNLPANGNYAVVVTPNQDAVAYVSGKTSTGFNVTLNPRLAANTLAAGTFDLLVMF
jgi:hypothetical protein